MNILSVDNLSKRFGERLLFEDLTFGLNQGQKMALVAKNGEGKTTLLELLAGTIKAETGNITWRNDVKVAYLRQDPSFGNNQSIRELFYEEGNETSDAIIQYHKLLDTDPNSDAFQAALNKMDQSNAWDYEAKIEKLLSTFELKLDLNTPISKLSGGQKKRLSIIQCMLQEPDFFILDEPTNHLDVNMIEWLEDFFSKENITLFMVTHDRYFLNAVCNQILELDYGKGYKYNGNYEYFLEKKAERIESHSAEVQKAKNLYRKEVEWMRRMPKARGTKAKSRIESFYEIEQKSKERRNEDQLNLSIKSDRIGNKILEIHHLKKAYGSLKIVDDFNYVFKKGDKVGIAGKNGVGKSTFLNLIMGIEELNGGKIVHGETIKFGYYTQSGMNLKEDKRVIEQIKEIAEVIPMEKGKKITAAQLLERFLFNRKQQYDYVSKLSGGEKKRLYLLTILMQNPNFLILDEPTNDLDIKTIQVLEEFLLSFPGILMIVSHDRSFMDRLTNHIFHFKGDGKIKDFNGSYSALIQLQKDELKEVNQEVKAVKIESKKKDNYTDRLSYKEQREFDQLELEIEKLESERESCYEILNGGNTDSELLNETSIRLNKLLQDIETKTERWMELADRA